MAILAPHPSHSLLFPIQHHPHQRQLPPHCLIKSPSKFNNVARLSSPTPTPVVTTEEDDSSSLSPATPTATAGCMTCGREEVENGCNGEGRIQGGIATVPGFGWWPIKAYRPCPGFVASGGRYRRRGQSMDEVTSGRGKARAVPLKIVKEEEVDDDDIKAKSSKKIKDKGKK